MNPIIGEPDDDGTDHIATCPVCGRPDWCLVAPDRTAAICPRAESAKKCGDAGWLHRLTDGTGDRRRFVLRVPDRTAPGDFGPLADRCVRACAPDRLAGLARSLGVAAGSLVALRVGWSADHLAWTFPTSDPAAGTTTGVRPRNPDGSKYAVKGSKDGPFIPATDPDPSEPLHACEGPTGTAAALTIGPANVAGRPSCSVGTAHAVALVRRRRPGLVVVVADADGPGLAGAGRLAWCLVKYAREVRLVTPPAGVKDLRQWVGAGASRRDLDELVAATQPRRLAVRVVCGGRVVGEYAP